MKTYAVLVRQLPDDVDFDTAARPMMDTLRELAPCPPATVTATTGSDAELLIKARTIGTIASQAERLALQPGDVVTVRLDREVADVTEEVFAAYCEALETAFPDNKIVVLERETTITAAPAAEETSNGS